MQTPILDLLVTCVKKYAYLVVRDYGEISNLLANKQSAKKYAMASNLKFQNSAFDDLKLFKPTYGFEFANSSPIINQDKSNTFLISGILGINNFTRAIPYFALSIALKRDGNIFAGVVYNPITLDIFYAQHNEGAYYNNKRLRFAPSNLSIQEQLVATDTYRDGLFCNNNCFLLDVAFFLANKIDRINFINSYTYNEAGLFLLLAKEAGCILKYNLTNGLFSNIYND